MFPTAARLSKASRAPLTPKRGNKDFYKGTRQAFLPGGHRTGAPGRHVIGGKAKYQLDDEKVRVFVAPPLHEILNSPLKPYVELGKYLTSQQEQVVWGKFRSTGALTPRHYLRVAREHTMARTDAAKMLEQPKRPAWMNARVELELEQPQPLPDTVRELQVTGAGQNKS